METRICKSADCRKEFEPINKRQEFCTHTCGTRERVRRLRARPHHRRPDPPPGGPPNGTGGGLYATVGGAVEYGGDGSASDKNVYYVKLAKGFGEFGFGPAVLGELGFPGE